MTSVAEPLTCISALCAVGLLTALVQPHSGEQLTEEDSVDRADSKDIASALEGDGSAFARLVKRYQNGVAAKMWRFTRDKDVLEELVQDTFVEAYKSLRSFKTGSSFVPWLMTIAVRIGYRHWRTTSKGRKEHSLDDFEVITAPSRQADPSFAADVLHRVFGNLPPRDRLVLTLMYFENHSVAEVAELTGWSRVMVKVQAHRARGKLKKLIALKMAKES